MCVRVLLKSNWGHCSRLGLTELQLFDSATRRLSVAASDVTVLGADDVKGHVENLFNGKCKVH